MRFGYWDLALYNFEGPFYVQIPAGDDQGPLDRALVTMPDRRDHETTPEARAEVEQEMRDTLRRRFGSAVHAARRERAMCHRLRELGRQPGPVGQKSQPDAARVSHHADTITRDG